MKKVLQEVGKRQNDLEKFIRQYAEKNDILPTIQWIVKEARAGRDWKSGKLAYEAMYREEVIEPATKLFEEMNPSSIATGAQLDMVIF